MDAPITILLVEDNEGDIILFEEYIATYRHHKLTIAKDLAKAKQQLQTNSFNVIMLDLNLPDSNGIQTVKSIISMETNAAIVIFTGLYDEELGQKAIKLGAQDFLVKNNLNPELLHKTINYAISRNKDRYKLNHLNKVLQATRKINQLITHTDDVQELINSACEMYVSSNVYYATWLILLDENSQIKQYAYSGITDERFNRYRIEFNKGIHPKCLQYTSENNNFVSVLKDLENCDKCKLYDNCTNNVAFIYRLNYKGCHLGYFGAVNDVKYRHNKDEIDLFIEISGDISFSIYTINQSIEKQEIKSKYLEEQRKLKESEERLNITIKGANIGIWDWDIVENKFIINEVCAQQLGYRLSEVSPLLNWLISLIHPEDKKGAERLMVRHLSDKSSQFEIELRIKHKSGEWIWIETKGKVTQRDKNGTPTRMCGIQIDINEKKKSELLLKQQQKEILAQIHEYESLNEEYISLNENLNQSNSYLQKVNKELSEAKELAEQNEKLKSAFLANMSHEIRTPMNAIIGFSSLLESDELENNKRNIFVDQINTASNRLLQIVNDIIDISKLEANQLSVHTNECNICTIFMNSYDLFIQSALLKSKPELSLIPNTKPEYQNIMAQVDNIRLGQVLDNLLSNAIKYSERGSVEFGFSVKTENNKEWIEVFVKDTGIGIRKEKHDLVFERFRQVEELDYHEGAGLGLSISKGLVELMGGKIWFESEYGKGSTFYFTIPYVPLADSPCDYQSKNSKEYILNLRGKKILIAEDDSSSYEYLKEILNESKAEIFYVENGEQLINNVENICPDIVLLDINMPIKSGLHCLKEMKEMHLLDNMKIIAQTAYAMSSEREKCLSEGCHEYLAKPFTKEELFEKMSKVLV
ncbi:response regulator [Prolixibacteraceae bacterium JC049]|nr:response regulator [Prolixibacteraceae bacterium JC049]